MVNSGINNIDTKLLTNECSGQNMLSKGIMQENKSVKNCKQFKTCSGSPIIYTKFKKARGIYYPVAKTHKCSKNVKKGKKLKNCCIVNSRTYGREVYEKKDIWPDVCEREKLVRISEEVTLIPEDECLCSDDNEDDSVDDTLTDYSMDRTDESRPDDVTSPEHPGGKHVTITVTDTSALGSPDSVERQIHPALDRPNSPTEQGTWPLKRSQSVDSRENPFLPGGDLSREADDILARAKIVRDTFILEEGKKDSSQILPERSRDTKCEKPNHIDDEPIQTPINETFTPETAKNAETSPNADIRPKENGQIDTDDSLSPGSVKMELIDDNKDRKKHKKCCTIM